MLFELCHLDGSVREYATEEAALHEIYQLVERGDRAMAADTALSCSTVTGPSRPIAAGDVLVDRAVRRFGRQRRWA